MAAPTGNYQGMYPQAAYPNVTQAQGMQPRPAQSFPTVGTQIQSIQYQTSPELPQYQQPSYNQASQPPQPQQQAQAPPFVGSTAGGYQGLYPEAAYPYGTQAQGAQPQPVGSFPTLGTQPQAVQYQTGPELQSPPYDQPIQPQQLQQQTQALQPIGGTGSDANPIQPSSGGGVPPADAPPRKGLFGFFRRGQSDQTQQQQPDVEAPGNPANPELGGQPPTELGRQQGSLAGSQPATGQGGEQARVADGTQHEASASVPNKDPLQIAMVSYERSYTHREDSPAVAASVLLTFDVGRFSGAPLALPERLTAEREGRFAREELGLFRERQCVLSEHSLNKMEQRITKGAPLDKALLAQMDSGDAAAAEQQVAIMERRRQQQQLQQQQQQQQQQLTVGNLPTVTEEPEGQQGEAGGQEQRSEVLKLPPPSSSAAQQPQPGQPGQMTDASPQPAGAGGGASGDAQPQPAPPPQQPPEMQPDGPRVVPGLDPATVPPHATIMDPMYAFQWLDENGLMVYVPDPLKRPGRERPARRYDQDKEMMRTYVRRPAKAASLRGETRLYRLDIELGRLEFLVHPAMAQEDLLAARLLALFRDFKRREAVGLVMFYASKLAALEDSMLGAREKLFALQATEAQIDEVLDAYAMLAKIEREVAEMRQLKEEEEALLNRTVRSMEQLHMQIQGLRRQQGYALTNLELAVHSKPPQELAWQQGVLTRERLDVLLVAAELEEIAGLPKFPEPLPVPDLADFPLPNVNPNPNAGGLGSLPLGLGMGVGGFLAPGLMDPLAAAMTTTATTTAHKPFVFKLRRCESMCAAHTAVLSDIAAQLEVLKNRPSTDPEDPHLKALEEQVALVGRAPRRMSMTSEEQLELQLKATEMVKKGEIFVSRMPQLVPILTINQRDPQQQQMQQQQMMTRPPQPGQDQQLGQAPGSGPLPIASFPGQLAPPPPRPSLKYGGKGRYYVKLFVNGYCVDYSEVTSLGDNFAGDFKDTFTIQVSRFPESISVMLFERHTLRDSYIGQVYIAIPGLAGSPHVDVQARPYQFTALTPFRPRLPTQGPGPVPLMPDTHFHDSSYNFNTIFPAGVLYVRCGWVSDRTPPGTRLADTVQPNAVIAYDNPLAERPAAGGQAAAAAMWNDIEAGKSLMPPRASVPIDRMLRRAAERIGGKANRAQIMRWLNEHVIDPNDPRNAPLLELLKTHEANASALGDLFRLDIFPDVAMKEDRAATRRMHVLQRRWQAGIYRAPDRSLLKGVRSVAIPAPLSAAETDKLENQYLDQLALLEQASEGTQLALARVMMARHEKAMQLQIGAMLTNAIKEREERIRAFALRVRAAAARVAGGLLMARHFRTEDVVNDAPLPQFKLELAVITQLLAPRRPLKRTRKLVKSLMTSVPRDTQLMVTVQRAANLPARMVESGGYGAVSGGAAGRGRNVRRPGRFGGGFDDGEGMAVDEGPSTLSAADREAQQRNCFVEIRFRSLVQRTEAVPGEFPLFNEQIDLDVFRDDGSDQQQKSAEEGSGLEPSPSALQANNDLITFNVFDELIVEPSETAITRRRRPGDEDLADPVRLPERERRFLGCIRVPLSAVYQLQVLEGTFKLEAPPVVLGYVQTSDRPSTLTVHMTMRPRLAAPAGEVDERVVSSEQAQVNRHAQKWLAALLARPECRSRILKVMAVDADGAAILVCRYIAATPLPPPVAQLAAAGGNVAAAGGVEALMLKLSRFVSHVPYMEDVGIQKRRNDIWTTNAEFLHLTGGDAEEHAHLLAGFFLQLGLQCFVVMGTAICGARSYFVLTTGQPAASPSQPQQPPPSLDLNPALLRLWNPVTGIVTAVKDPTGELREVGQLYDGTNIWANTQPTGRPWEMRWSLGAVKDWDPFFGAALPPREIASLQTTPLYEELDGRFYEELESRVEKRVEEALSKARSTFVTKPDNKVSRLLKSLLKEMREIHEKIAAASLKASAELAETGGQGPTDAPAYLGERHKLIQGLQASHNERIRRESRAESANGHILAMSFSDRYLDAVSEAVTNTGIHRVADDRVKFSTAVYVEPLGAAFVCCIWIYVVAIRG